ncbi:MAG: DUF1565 domain-containing protein [Leptolyngbya sp. Prado105]|nr:DUF1565 domain-containing protein [Leptolyngbya sp. Prado105]
MGYLTQSNALWNDSLQVHSQPWNWDHSPLSAAATESRFAALSSDSTIYVSVNGADSNSGEQNRPFRTIQHAIDAANPGDTVLIQEGIYYERQLSFRKSGEKDKPITMRSAPGARVIIDHGLQTREWQNIGGSIYQAAAVVSDATNDNVDFTKRIVVDHQALVRVDDPDALKEGTYWVDTSNGKISLWAMNGAKPTQENTVLINWHDQFKTGIHLFDRVNHVVIDGIVDRGGETGIWAAHWKDGIGEDLVVQNCEITASWDSAIRFDNWNLARLSNNNIHNNAIVQAPRNSGVNWPHAIVGSKANHITIDHNKIHDNHGEGVGPTQGCNDWTIRDNEVFDNWSVNIYLDSDGENLTVDGNFIYNTGKYNQSDRDRPDGVRISNEPIDIGTDGESASVRRVSVINNVILNTGGGIRFLNYNNGPSYLANSIIANNTIHAVDPNTDSIYIVRGDDVKVINNITDSGTIELGNGLGAGIAASHNLIPHSSAIVSHGNNVQLGESVIGIPKFTVGRGHVAENYRIQDDSPAKDAGVELPEVPHDYASESRRSSAIGAFR